MTALHPLVAFHVGDTFSIDGACNDVAGNVIDLTNALLIEWKLADECGNVVADLTLGNGIAVTNAADGEIVITLTATATAAFKPGRYKDQLRVQTAAGIMSTQWVGFIDVKGIF